MIEFYSDGLVYNYVRIVVIDFGLELEARKNLAIEAKVVFYHPDTGDFIYKDMR